MQTPGTVQCPRRWARVTCGTSACRCGQGGPLPRQMPQLPRVVAGSGDSPGLQAWRPYAGKAGWLSASGGMPCQTTMRRRLTRRAGSGPGSRGGVSCSTPWRACGSPCAASERLSLPATPLRWPSGWKQRRGARRGQTRASRPRPGAPTVGGPAASHLRRPATCRQRRARGRGRCAAAGGLLGAGSSPRPPPRALRWRTAGAPAPGRRRFAQPGARDAGSGPLRALAAIHRPAAPHPADRAVLAAQALQNQRRDDQHVDVSYDDQPAGAGTRRQDPRASGEIAPPAQSRAADRPD